MRQGHLFLALAIFMMLIGNVSAVDSICEFNGSVDLNKSDLPAYMADQTGCGVQNFSSNMSGIIIVIFIFFVLLFIYGVVNGGGR